MCHDWVACFTKKNTFCGLDQVLFIKGYELPLRRDLERPGSQNEVAESTSASDAELCMELSGIAIRILYTHVSISLDWADW